MWIFWYNSIHILTEEINLTGEDSNLSRNVWGKNETLSLHYFWTLKPKQKIIYLLIHILIFVSGIFQPLVLLSWGCYLSMSHVDPEAAQWFIVNHALKGPEEIVNDGNYSLGLIEKSKIVTNSYDVSLCPNFNRNHVYWRQDEGNFILKARCAVVNIYYLVSSLQIWISKISLIKQLKISYSVTLVKNHWQSVGFGQWLKFSKTWSVKQIYKAISETISLTFSKDFSDF